jgi:hypothetical protein
LAFCRDDYISFDKGNLSEEMYVDFSNEEDIHFVTTISLLKNRELATLPDSSYTLLSIDKNQRPSVQKRPEYRITGALLSNVKDEDKYSYLLAYNKSTADKKDMTLQNRLDKMAEHLKEMQSKYNKSKSKTNDIAELNSRFEKYCNEHNYASICFSITTFTAEDGTFRMEYCRNDGIIQGLMEYYGKHLMCTNDISQTAEEIYTINNDNWKVEAFFKLLNDQDFIGALPLHVWDDKHIVLHLGICVIAGSLTNYLELKLNNAGIKMTGKCAFSTMESLRCRNIVLKSGKVIVVVDEPDAEQMKIIDALGYYYSNGNILKKGASEFKGLGYTPGPGRPLGSRNKPKVA